MIGIEQTDPDRHPMCVSLFKFSNFQMSQSEYTSRNLKNIQSAKRNNDTFVILNRMRIYFFISKKFIYNKTCL